MTERPGVRAIQAANVWRSPRALVLRMGGAAAIALIAAVGAEGSVSEMIWARAEAQDTTAPAASMTQTEPSVADRAALRHLARAGDVERLEAELRRLRTRFPDWSPPSDLLDPSEVEVDLEQLNALVKANRYDEARAFIAERRAAEPGYEPPAGVLMRIEMGEVRRALELASEAAAFDEVLRIAEENERILTCDEVESIWRVAEAFAQTDRPERAFDAYAYVLSTCEDATARATTLERATENLSPDRMIDLLELAETPTRPVRHAG